MTNSFHITTIVSMQFNEERNNKNKRCIKQRKMQKNAFYKERCNTQKCNAHIVVLTCAIFLQV